MNTHHLLYPRKMWDSKLEKMLRNHPYLKAEIPEGLHKELHIQVGIVPKPPAEALTQALEALEYLGAHTALRKDAGILTRLNVLLTLWEGQKGCEPTCDAIKSQIRIVADYYFYHS